MPPENTNITPTAPPENSAPLPEAAPPSEIPVEAPVPPAETPLPPPVQTDSRSFIARGLEVIRFRKRAKLEKIVAFAKQKGSVTNDEVEKLLRVSHATATRYLSELVRQNRLKRLETNNSTRYESVSS